MSGIQNHVCVVTGAARGLGRSVALELKERGATVVGSDLPIPELNSLKEILPLTISADVTDQKALAQLAEETVSSFGRIDVWINNAGVWMPHTSTENITKDDIEHLVAVNLYGTIFGSQAAIGAMQEHGGTIMNILSVSALSGRAFSSGYAASKWAARGYSLSLRAEMAERNLPIRVLSVYPGRMKTNLFDDKKPDDIESYLDPRAVAKIIIENLESLEPNDELTIDRDHSKEEHPDHP